MDDRDASQVGMFGPVSPDSSGPPRKVSSLLFLWPLVGFISVVAAVVMYRPLDDVLIWWIGGISCLVIYTLINVAWRNAKSGEDARFLPRPVWLAVGSLFVPTVLFLNGALDQSHVEQHRQFISRTILEHGRHGSINYYIEVSSWRSWHSHEKLGVSESKYLDFNVMDPVIIET